MTVEQIEESKQELRQMLKKIANTPYPKFIKNVWKLAVYMTIGFYEQKLRDINK